MDEEDSNNSVDTGDAISSVEREGTGTVSDDTITTESASAKSGRDTSIPSEIAIATPTQDVSPPEEDDEDAILSVLKQSTGAKPINSASAHSSSPPGAVHITTTSTEANARISKVQTALEAKISPTNEQFVAEPYLQPSGQESNSNCSSASSTPPPIDLQRERDIQRSSTTAVASVPGAVNVIPASDDDQGLREEEETSVSEESQSPQVTTPIEDAQSGELSFRVTAVRVDDPDVERAQLEAQIRNQVLQEALQADVVPLPAPVVGEEHEPKSRSRRVFWLMLLLFLSVIVGLVVGLTFGLRNNGEEGEGDLSSLDDSIAFNSTASTLQQVLDRGFVRCGVRPDFPGLAMGNGSIGKAQWEGMTFDQCRAISIVVFGNPDQYSIVRLTRRNRLTMLQEGQIDVLGIFFAWTMAADIFTPSIQCGVWFSTPYLYSGFGFVGDPDNVKCADQLDSWSPECRGLKVCVVETSVNRDTLQKLLPGGVVVLSDTADALTERFNAGDCNVIATWPVGSPEVRFRLAGYQGDFMVGEKVFTHEDLSLMARDNDPEWSRIIETVVQTFILAEANNITKANAHEMRDLFGNGTNWSLAATMEAIVSEFGNYGDLYKKHFQQKIPRRGVNLLYEHPIPDTGLLYSLPFRNLEAVGPGPTRNGTLDRILQRGHLSCGVTNSSKERRALNTEFCYAVAAAIFAGDKTRIQLVDLGSNSTSSPLHACEALEDRSVDLVAGVRLSLQVLLGLPPFDQQFYAFSKPYFYDAQTMSAFALMCRADDSQWDSFVFWVAMSLIYAEEEEITQSLWPQMPVTSLFGESLKQCFRDAVFAVGHYGEMYNRTLESVWPRSGGNLLNDGSGEGYGPQHFPIPLF